MTVRAAITPGKYAMTESERTKGEKHGTAPEKGYACQELLQENGFPYWKFLFLNFFQFAFVFLQAKQSLWFLPPMMGARKKLGLVYEKGHHDKEQRKSKLADFHLRGEEPKSNEQTNRRTESPHFLGEQGTNKTQNGWRWYFETWVPMSVRWRWMVSMSGWI